MFISLRRKILLPLVLVASTLTTGFSVLIYQYVNTSIGDRLLVRAETFADSIRRSIEIRQNNFDYQRLINAYGESEDVELIFLSSGEPLTIVAANKYVLVDTVVSKLPDKILAQSMIQVMKNKQADFNHLQERQQYIVTIPVLLAPVANAIRPQNAIITVKFDTSSERQLVIQSSLMWAGAFTLSLLVVAAIIFRFLDKLIVVPLKILRSTAILREHGSTQVRSALSTNDELGELSQAFNAMLDHIEKESHERSAAQRALTESEKRFRNMANQAPAFIWVADTENKGIWYNASWLKYTGRTIEQEMGFGWIEGVHPGDRERSAAFCQSAFDQRIKFDMELRLKRADGTYGWIADTGIPRFDKSGSFQGYIGYCWDITERKKAESEMLAAKQDAELANRAKSEFLSSMSHELRTPLNAVLGFSQLIEIDPNIPDKHKGGAKEIYKAGLHLLNLINDILDLSKIESGHLNLSIEPLALTHIIEQSRILIERLANKGNITFEYDLNSDSELFVYADQTRLQQVLLNLLSNAVKYNNDHGKVILACNKLDDEYVRIRIEDTGTGIDNNKIDKLFQSFTRLVSEDSPIEGTGIGLVITKQLVERMGGRIGVESTPGKGSTFWIDLKFVSDSNKDGVTINLDLQANPGRGNDISDKKKTSRILVAEDNPASQQLLIQQLDLLNYSADMVSNGMDAWQRWQEKDYDILLTDINMPKMNGFKLTENIRSNEHTHGLSKPIIAITANAMQGDKDRYLDAGMDDCITKPVNISELESKLKKWLVSDH